MTFDAIVTRVRTNIVDDNDEVVEEITNLIHEAQEDLEDLFIFRWTRSTLGKTTVVSTRTLGEVSEDWNELRLNPFYIDGTGASHPMEWLPDSDEVERRYGTFDPLDVGSPKELLLTPDGELYVYPLPDGNCISGDLYSDGEYRIRIPYWKRLAPLASGTDNAFGDDPKCAKYITERATADAFLFNRDNDQWRDWFARSELTLSKIKRKFKCEELPMDLHLRPHISVRASRRERR